MPERGTSAVLNARESRSTGWHTEMGKMQIGSGQNGWWLYVGILFATKIPNGKFTKFNVYFFHLFKNQIHRKRTVDIQLIGGKI